MVPKMVDQSKWPEVTLGDLTKESAFGPRFSSSLYSENGNVGTIRTTDLNNDGIINYQTIPYADLSEINFKSHFLNNGDLLITRSGTCGIPCVFESQEKPIVAGAFLIRFTLKETVEPLYLHMWLKSVEAQLKIQRMASGGVQKNLTGTNLKKLEIKLPPLPEQKKIVKILSTWDRAIEVTENLLKNSLQQKKSLMQQLLTGKKRLLGFKINDGYIKTRYGLIPTDWGFVHIEDVANQVIQKNSDGLEIPVLSCSKYDGFVDSLKYFNKKVYSDDTSGYKIIERGCFGFPSNHIEEGSIGYQNLYDAGIVSPIYTIFRPNPKKINSDYLYKLLKTEHYRQIFAASTNASVDRRGSLRWKEFSKIRVPLPSLEEQRKIASILSVADKEIEILKQKLACLRQEKKALMQQLLTGKRRVKVDEDLHGEVA